MPAAKSILEALEDKILVGDGCWQWTGAKDRKGYGMLHRNQTTVKAHRVVYELLVGPIPEGLQLDHLCRNRGCVRPSHLEPVTCRENIHRGDGLAGIAARATHCKHGHDLSTARVRHRKDRVRPVRDCLLCEQARNRGRS